MFQRSRVLATGIALAACASPSPNRPLGDIRAVDVRAMDECDDLAAIYPSRNAESLQTLFDLCMQAKDALK